MDKRRFIKSLGALSFSPLISASKLTDFKPISKSLPVIDNEDEAKLITTMKKASRLMIIGNSDKGEQTTDHYSMMGFTKAYNSAKKSCG